MEFPTESAPSCTESQVSEGEVSVKTVFCFSGQIIDFLFRITCMHLPLQSKWLYVGTEKGNIHIVHIESFALSGYVINWNKAIEV